MPHREPVELHPDPFGTICRINNKETIKREVVIIVDHRDRAYDLPIHFRTEEPFRIGCEETFRV